MPVFCYRNKDGQQDCSQATPNLPKLTGENTRLIGVNKDVQEDAYSIEPAAYLVYHFNWYTSTFDDTVYFM